MLSAGPKPEGDSSAAGPVYPRQNFGPVKCIVCDERVVKYEFFRVPETLKRLRVWARALYGNDEDAEYFVSSVRQHDVDMPVVCYRHFKSDDIVNTPKEATLRPNTVPLKHYGASKDWTQYSVPRRKCIVCGATREPHEVFPFDQRSPRLRQWCDAICPEQAQANRLFDKVLRSPNPVLCGSHFDSSQFVCAGELKSNAMPKRVLTHADGPVMKILKNASAELDDFLMNGSRSKSSGGVLDGFDEWGCPIDEINAPYTTLPSTLQQGVKDEYESSSNDKVMSLLTKASTAMATSEAEWNRIMKAPAEPNDAHIDATDVPLFDDIVHKEESMDEREQEVTYPPPRKTIKRGRPRKTLPEADDPEPLPAKRKTRSSGPVVEEEPPVTKTKSGRKIKQKVLDSDFVPVTRTSGRRSSKKSESKERSVITEEEEEGDDDEEVAVETLGDESAEEPEASFSRKDSTPEDKSNSTPKLKLTEKQIEHLLYLKRQKDRQVAKARKEARDKEERMIIEALKMQLPRLEDEFGEAEAEIKSEVTDGQAGTAGTSTSVQSEERRDASVTTDSRSSSEQPPAEHIEYSKKTGLPKKKYNVNWRYKPPVQTTSGRAVKARKFDDEPLTRPQKRRGPKPRKRTKEELEELQRKLFGNKDATSIEDIIAEIEADVTVNTPPPPKATKGTKTSKRYVAQHFSHAPKHITDEEKDVLARQLSHIRSDGTIIGKDRIADEHGYISAPVIRQVDMFPKRKKCRELLAVPTKKLQCMMCMRGVEDSPLGLKEHAREHCTDSLQYWALAIDLCETNPNIGLTVERAVHRCFPSTRERPLAGEGATCELCALVVEAEFRALYSHVCTHLPSRPYGCSSCPAFLAHNEEGVEEHIASMCCAGEVVSNMDAPMSDLSEKMFATAFPGYAHLVNTGSSPVIDEEQSTSIGSYNIAAPPGPSVPFSDASLADRRLPRRTLQAADIELELRIYEAIEHDHSFYTRAPR